MAGGGGSSIWDEVDSLLEELQRQQKEHLSSAVVDPLVISGPSPSAEEADPSPPWAREVRMVSLQRRHTI